MEDSLSALSQKLISKLEKEREKSFMFFNQLNSKDWHIKTYSEAAAWSVNDVLAHIVIAEESLGDLMKSIVTEGSGVSDDFDLKEFNERTVADIEVKDSSVLLEKFKKNRNKNIEMIKNFSDNDFKAVGSHPYFGEAEVSEMIKLMIIHINLHIRDIRRTIKGNNEKS